MFSAVELYIQDQKITQDQGLYPWLAYVKLITGCTENEIAYFLRQALWRRDDSGLFDQVTFDKALKNSGFVERHAYIQKSNDLPLLMKVMFDFTIDRLITDKTEILVRFRHAEPSLCLLAKGNKYNISVKDAGLLVAKSNLTSDGSRVVNSALNSPTGLQYPSTRVVMRTKVVSKNDQNCEWVPYSGALPKRIFVFQVSQDAFNNDITKKSV